MMNNSLAGFMVTTSQNPGAETVRRAKEFSQIHSIPFQVRDDSLECLTERFQLDGAFVFFAHEMILWYAGSEIRFHTNMAKHRILNMINDGQDRMQMVMDLQSGDSLLDCTLGLGTDAIVASFIVGPSGNVTALESQLPLYLLISKGLAEYTLPGKEYIIAPMRRIKTCHAEALEYMQGLPSAYFDIVYLDPMFRKPRKGSQGIRGVRMLSNESELTIEHIQEARRVAAKSVILKERPGSSEFARLGFTELPLARGAAVSYGVIRI
jgi:16S rRNA (guanine1516-N2)-methyltransferase